MQKTAPAHSRALDWHRATVLELVVYSVAVDPTTFASPRDTRTGRTVVGPSGVRIALQIGA